MKGNVVIYLITQYNFIYEFESLYMYVFIYKIL